MRRNASAATAGPTKSRGGSFGDFLRGALATRASSRRIDGSGASAAGPRSRRPLGLLLVPVLALSVFAGSVAPASGATQRPFKEVFGAAEQPIFQFPTRVTVDPGTGDVLVGDFSKQGILRFNADGTPEPFAALGTNLIDGREANGKPCAEEPDSCDQTPQNGMGIGNPDSQQMAVDNSGGATDGNIYITQFGTPVIDIFASDGKYLGQIDAAGTEKLSGILRGVAIDATGVIYAALGQRILKYTPTSNPPVNEDYDAPFTQLPSGEDFLNIALGSGPTADSIFAVVVTGNGDLFVSKINKATGERDYRFAEGYGLSGIAVDPESGRVLVGKKAFDSEEIAEFDASGDSAVQVGHVLGGPGHPITNKGFSLTGSGDELYVVGEPNSPLAVFGAPTVAPTVTADPASEITGSKALLSGRVDPEGLELTDCYFEYGEFAVGENAAACEGTIPTGAEPKTVRANISSLVPGGHTYKYRLVAETVNVRGESALQSFLTASTVATEAPNPIGTTTATLRGTIRPEGSEYSACFFEYGLASSDDPEKTVPCTPSSAAIEPDFVPHQVSAAISGMQAGVSYRFVLVATNPEGTLRGEEVTFTTLGKPQIGEIRARDANQSSATVEAKINPSGFGTSYHFEWGPTGAYGNDIPVDIEPFIGSETEPVRVMAKISGLLTGTTYHYRVVATNSAGTTESPDQILETLNSCGLPRQRCFELVSPREAGPVAAPGENQTGNEMQFQAAPNPGRLAYIVESGFPDSTRGAEVLYRGMRGTTGWNSIQISAPILAPGETKTPNSNSSVTMALSPELSCGVQASSQPLTSDATTRPVVEAGGSNLYRHNPDGSYTAISKLTPTNFEEVTEFLENEYQVRGMSADCGKVVFETRHMYPGVPAVAEVVGNVVVGSILYEWDEGELRNVGSVPGPDGEVVVPAVAGISANRSNVVSDDGSRVFFSAERRTSPNPAEIGLRAVFVRENGITRDLSLSETSTPGTGATYQYAAADGSRVFFTADAGLTEESSIEGVDLYEYDLKTEDLTDLSIEDDPGGAQVGGFIGASTDGTHVYFVARGQLVSGRGNTFAQNQDAHTYSVYGTSNGQVEYAGVVKADELLSGVTANDQRQTSSRVSADGKFLLFETAANVTDYQSGGLTQAYLYSAGDKGVTCVSCRLDGQPSLPSPPEFPLLSSAAQTINVLHQVESLVVVNDQPSVYFVSRNRLAPGGVDGLYSLYEWSHDQVFAIDTESPGLSIPAKPRPRVRFAGASADGSDLYFATRSTLTWEDSDGRSSVYDARVGGGYPEPPPSPVPCEPTSEGSCQGVPGPQAPMPGPASTTFIGPGNAKPKKPQKRHKKHHKKKKHQKKQGEQKHHANGNRRAGK